MDVIKEILDIILAVMVAIGGGAGVYFWRVNKDYKKEEVKEKAADVDDKHQQTWSKQNDELQEYIRLLKEDKDELKRENKEKSDALEEMRHTLNDVVKRVSVLEAQIQVADGFRCEVITCVNRKPPMSFMPQDNRESLAIRNN